MSVNVYYLLDALFCIAAVSRSRVAPSTAYVYRYVLHAVRTCVVIKDIELHFTLFTHIHTYLNKYRKYFALLSKIKTGRSQLVLKRILHIIKSCPFRRLREERKMPKENVNLPIR